MTQNPFDKRYMLQSWKESKHTSRRDTMVQLLDAKEKREVAQDDLKSRHWRPLMEDRNANHWWRRYDGDNNVQLRKLAGRVQRVLSNPFNRYGTRVRATVKQSCRDLPPAYVTRIGDQIMVQLHEGLRP
jgi:hypothetical protein